MEKKLARHNFTDNIDELNKEIDSVWGYADFGESLAKIHVVKYALLKVASGYSNGYTADRIIKHLGFITSKKRDLTKKGKYWLWEFFKDGYKSCN